LRFGDLKFGGDEELRTSKQECQTALKNRVAAHESNLALTALG
jgi:hypothetical protein